MNVLTLVKMKVKAYPLLVCCIEPENDILFSNYRKNVRVDLNTAKELVASRLEFTENKKHYHIFEFSNVQQITNEAIQYMQDENGGLKNIIAVAVVANNPISALIANALIQPSETLPARFFTKETDAEDWIKGLKKFN